MEQEATGDFDRPAPSPRPLAGTKAIDPRLRDLRGTEFDHFKIVALLGEGGFVSVRHHWQFVL